MSDSENDSDSESSPAESPKPVAKKPTNKRKNKKKKKKKPKDYPKRALSAFMFFSRDVRPEISRETKDDGTKYSFSEVAKEVSRRWKEMPAEEKKKYNELNKNDKIRYTKEMEAYTEKIRLNPPAPESSDESSDDEDQPPKKKKKKKKARDPNLPKRPKTAFFFYMDVMRPQVAKEFPNLTVAERSKYLGRKWRELSDEEKKPYLEENAVAKEKYKEAMIKYKANHGGD